MFLTRMASCVFLAGVLPIGASDSGCPVSPDAVALCAVLADYPHYDGKDILLQGVYDRMDGEVLTSSACTDKKVSLRFDPVLASTSAVAKKLDGLIAENRAAVVVVRGTFHAPPKACFGKGCLNYELAAHELLCVDRQKLAGKYRQ
jgi:hypothetical protein